MNHCTLSISTMLVVACCALPLSAQELAGTTDTTAATDATDASAPAATGRPARVRIGDATQALLATQVNGTAAGPALPMLGATAQASWLRYQESFKNKIPEFFGSRVRSNTVNTASTGQ